MSLRLRRLSTSDREFATQLPDVLAYSAEVDAEVEASVVRILADVQARGDAAVLEHTRRFDRIDAGVGCLLVACPSRYRFAHRVEDAGVGQLHGAITDARQRSHG